MDGIIDFVKRAEAASSKRDFITALGILELLEPIVTNSTLRAHFHTIRAGCLKDSGQSAAAVDELVKASEIYRGEKVYQSSLHCLIAAAMTSLYAHGRDMTHYHAITDTIDKLYMRNMARFRPDPKVMEPNKLLKIGFLSPDMCGHVLSPQILNTIGYLSKVSKHEYYAYFCREKEDAFSEAYKPSFTKWTHVRPTLSDDEIINIIRNDKIDILIDLSGFTECTRLDVFAARPAPVQVGWISGMMTPTGLSCIPYFITDKYMLPPDYDKITRSKLIVIPSATGYHSLQGNDPYSDALPYDRTGHITFTSFNNPCKLNTEVLSAWMSCLKQVPDSQLHVKYYNDIQMALVKEAAISQQIDPARVVGIPPLGSPADVTAYYSRETDICLDAWPCAGCLTTMECLWQGVPMVTYAGNTFTSRQSFSILSNIGLNELAAGSPSGFVFRAVELAKDIPKLRSLRKTLRKTMQESLLGNFPILATHLVAGLETAWKDACGKYSCKSEVELLECKV